jgi:hypothetical protein
MTVQMFVHAHFVIAQGRQQRIRKRYLCSQCEPSSQYEGRRSGTKLASDATGTARIISPANSERASQLLCRPRAETFVKAERNLIGTLQQWTTLPRERLDDSGLFRLATNANAMGHDWRHRVKVPEAIAVAILRAGTQTLSLAIKNSTLVRRAIK